MTTLPGSISRLRNLISPTAFWAFLLSRLWVALWVYSGHAGRQPGSLGFAGAWEGVDNYWVNPWTTFDSYWFLRIAAEGYNSMASAFFPAYPSLLSLAGPNPIAMAIWGVVISNLALLAALEVLKRLTEIEHDPAVARLAVWAVAFFPASAYFSAVYTESLFLLLLTSTFLSVRRGRWGWAGLLALAAALTRNSGLLIFLAMAIEYGAAIRRKEPQLATPGSRRIALFSVSMPLIAFAAVQGYFLWRFGREAVGMANQEYYNREVSWPWMPILLDLREMVTSTLFNASDYIQVLTVLATFALVAMCRMRIRLSYATLTLGIITMNLICNWPAPPHTNSSVRFMMTTFPFSQMLALKTRELADSRISMVLLIIIELGLCAICSWIFGAKGFIG